MRLHHVAVICKSEENADRFYKDILGLSRAKTSLLHKDFSVQIFGIAEECQYIFYEDEMLAVEVFVVTQTKEKLFSFAHVCLEVENREKFLEKCEEQGVEVKRIAKGDSFVVFLFDFDGNLFEIKESSSQAPN